MAVKKKTKSKPLAAGVKFAPDKERVTLDGMRYVFTCAQNNTHVHQEFLAALTHFCKDRGAKLIVGTTTYNKSGFQNGFKNSDKVWFDPKITDYIVNVPAEVAGEEDFSTGEGLVWCGELEILPTAVLPLSGLDNYTRDASAIVPHTKVQMQSVPTPKDCPAKLMYTTGAITQRNYIDRKTGQKAAFHHVFGALYVEIMPDGGWFARQLIASEDGSFYDLTDRYTADGCEGGHSVAAINWGDIHSPKLNEHIAVGAWGIRKNRVGTWKPIDFLCNKSMVDVLRPEHQFLHDTIDFSARNHHNRKHDDFMASTFHKECSNVRKEMKEAYGLLRAIERDFSTSVVVASNHDQAFYWWLRDSDFRSDPENAVYWLENQLELYMALERGESPLEYNVFAEAMRRFGPLNRTRFLDIDEQYTICGTVKNGIECGMHGHLGPNGARGNPSAFRKIGVKCNIGHTHSATVVDGVYVAGVSSNLDLGYNCGPSSWTHSHIVTYKNGKRAIITCRGSRWRA